MVEDRKYNQSDTAKTTLKLINEERMKLLKLLKADQEKYAHGCEMLEEYETNYRTLEEIGGSEEGGVSLPPNMSEELREKLRKLFESINKSEQAIDGLENLENELLNLFIGNHQVDIEKINLVREKLDKLFQEGKKI